MNNNSNLCTWLNMKHFENDIQIKLEKSLIKYDLSPVEFSFLHYLYNQYDCKATLLEIKDSLKLSSAAVSRMAVRLEKKDCKPITRYHSDNNQKEICLKITDSGIKHFKEAAIVVDAVLNEFFTSSDFLDLRDMILSTNIQTES
ncbi:MarR family transcriptional regulator [Companilactobacillus huachuanensis]|uniref:MarR family transcriptional regulator n=1 Tax=Companilactobacillus huachuanensis TaxID=2559914 RepID=A0ABW1RKD1_9LACO|nr:MarR family transcriptional regulator [Companilactobacillus huachuanensis]